MTLTDQYKAAYRTYFKDPMLRYFNTYCDFKITVWGIIDSLRNTK